MARIVGVVRRIIHARKVMEDVIQIANVSVRWFVGTKTVLGVEMMTAVNTQVRCYIWSDRYCRSYSVWFSVHPNESISEWVYILKKKVSSGYFR